MIRIYSETVGPFQENCYLLVDDATATAVLVDPGDEPERLLAMVAAAQASIGAIWITHAHLDHVGGINGVRRVHPVPVYLHPFDRPLYDRVNTQAALYGVPFTQPEPPDRELAEGDILTVGATRFSVLHTP
ncbi:MAG: MBL fold metallo-hydrolase, partial [Gemmatimonadaceae bacterium]